MANHLDIMRGAYGKAFASALDFMAIDTVTIYGEKMVRGDFGKVDREGYCIVKDHPCAISFGSSPTETASPLPDAGQDITLFLDTGVKVEPGAAIVVTQGMTGRTENYNMAGVPKVYDTHQEIALERTDRKSGITQYEDRDNPVSTIPGESAEGKG